MRLFVILHFESNSLLKKAGAMRRHQLSTSNATRYLQKDFQKTLRTFANKRQVKHTSTILEPSIPFHTLVKLVDAEDIANDKIRTHDLTLEVNNITKQLQTQSLHSQQSDQVMFTQPRDPNNKTKPAYKKYCSYCHRSNHSISACFKKQRDDEDKRDTYARSKSPQKSFVQYFRSSSNDKTQRYDTRPTEYTTRYRSRSTSGHDYQKQNRQRSTSKTCYNYDRTTTPPHYTRSRYDNNTEILLHIVHHIDPPTNHLIDVIHVPVTNLDHTQEITTFHDTLLLIDHRLDLEIFDILDLAPILRHETKSITFNHKLLLTQSILKYTCTTQQKWQTH